MAMEWTPVANCLFASSLGRSWREEAATWLLAEFGPGRSHWPEQLDQAGFLDWEEAVEDAPEDEFDMAWVRWDALADALVADGTSESMYGTRSEWAVLRFACALMTGRAGDWGNDLTLLDGGNRRLAVAALAWAAGGKRSALPLIPPLPEPGPPTVRGHLHTVQD